MVVHSPLMPRATRHSLQGRRVVPHYPRPKLPLLKVLTDGQSGIVDLTCRALQESLRNLPWLPTPSFRLYYRGQ